MDRPDTLIEMDNGVSKYVDYLNHDSINKWMPSDVDPDQRITKYPYHLIRLFNETSVN